MTTVSALPHRADCGQEMVLLYSIPSAFNEAHPNPSQNRKKMHLPAPNPHSSSLACSVVQCGTTYTPGAAAETCVCVHDAQVIWVAPSASTHVIDRSRRGYLPFRRENTLVSDNALQIDRRWWLFLTPPVGVLPSISISHDV